jgi:hypothetical protein
MSQLSKRPFGCKNQEVMIKHRKARVSYVLLRGLKRQSPQYDSRLEDCASVPSPKRVRWHGNINNFMLGAIATAATRT